MGVLLAALPVLCLMWNLLMSKETMMINIWSFMFLGLVSAPFAVLALVIWQTWTSGASTSETVGTVEHES